MYLIDCYFSRQEINGTDDELLDASEVIQALKAHRWTIPNEEQDAHELLNLLTTTLETEFYSSLPAYSLKDALLVTDLLESPNSAILRPAIKSRTCNPADSIVKPSLPKALPTRGLLASQVHCKNCAHKYPVRLDMFDSISLAIAIGGLPIIQLQDCLNKFVSNEIINDANCEGCTKEDVPNAACFVKTLTFAKLPPLLVFHMKRLVWLNNGMLVKRDEHVQFPEYLDMDAYSYCGRQSRKQGQESAGMGDNLGLLGGKVPFLDMGKERQGSRLDLSQFTDITGTAINTQNSKYRYRLSAVVVHLGGAYSGHFITYRRGGEDNQSSWFLTSDANVQRSSIKDVLASNAYMVFYERLKR